MDPVTIVGIVEGSISLAVQCGSVVKSLNCLAGQYKYAKLTISTMVQNLDIMQFTWDRIGAWSRDFIHMNDDALTQRLERFLEAGSLVLDALEEDLKSYDVSRMTIAQRSRLVWNEGIIQAHQSRIRDQAQSMSLFLQAIQLPTLDATASLLHQSKKQFMKSDESAFSIVPSNMSSRLSSSTGQTIRPDSIGSYVDMVYRRLSFEDELFTARVYKRNYRNGRSQSEQKKRSDLDQETITPPQAGRQHNHKVFKLKSQRTPHARTTTDISASTAEQALKQDAEFPVPKLSIKVTTTCISSVEEIDKKFEDRIGLSMSGQDGLYVKLTKNLEHRITSVSATYTQLVLACGRGDNGSVKSKLTMMPNSTLGSVDLPALLGSYISGSFYFCPIHAAVFNEQVEVMRTLLRRAELEGDLNWVVEKTIGGTELDPWRPLHVATLKGNFPMVNLLLENGASVLSRTGYGIQAAHLAAKIGSIPIIEALADAGADLNCTDLGGCKPLHYVSDSQHLPDAVKYLANRGAKIPGSPHAHELAPLHLACIHDFVGNLETLLYLGDLAGGFPTSDLESVLDTAIRHGSPLSVHSLLRRGVSLDFCCSDGGTSLHNFFLSLSTTAEREVPTVKRTLRLLLDRIDLLARDDQDQMVLDSMCELAEESHGIARADLARRLLGYLPQHRTSERVMLIEMINYPFPFE